MYFIIYKTINIQSGKIYIGAHQTKNIEDGYLGSGWLLRYAIKKYGKESFIREILYYCNDRISMMEKERELVNDEFVKLKTNYNIRVGGQGGWPIEQQKLNNIKSQKAQKLLRETNPEWVKNLSNKRSNIMKGQYNSGRRQVNSKPHIPGEYKHTEESKQKISDNKKGKTIGKLNPNAKKVIDNDGNIFDTIKECAVHKQVHPDTILRWIKQGKIQKLG